MALSDAVDMSDRKGPTDEMVQTANALYEGLNKLSLTDAEGIEKEIFLQCHDNGTHSIDLWDDMDIDGNGLILKEEWCAYLNRKRTQP